MPLILTFCFLFVVCNVHPRHIRGATAANSCSAIMLAYADKPGSRDDFVKTFPAAKQHHVLECIGDK